jgi:spore maturation protein CgeB
MPKLIVFGKSKRKTRKVAHIARAFSDLGNETLWLNAHRIRRWLKSWANPYILKRIERFDPDIVFIHNMDLPLPVLEKLSGTHILTVMYYHDGWRLDQLDEVAKWGRKVDLFLENAKGLHDQFREVGIKDPVFIIEGCDKHEHRIRKAVLPIWKSDVAFVGAARPDEPRIQLIRDLSQICKVRIYGKDWKRFNIRTTLREVRPGGYAKVCSGAKIMLGIDAVTTIEGHWTNRLWLTLGCGGFHLTNYIPGMEEVFENRKHLVWYHDHDECISLVREYLAKPEERKRIAMTGYSYVHEHHTFHHFARKVLDICDEAMKARQSPAREGGHEDTPH